MCNRILNSIYHKYLIRRYSTPSGIELSIVNNKTSTLDLYAPIVRYNLKQTHNLSDLDNALTTLLSNLNSLDILSISNLLKQCGIFIYRIKKYEKYSTSQTNAHRLRLLDALANSIPTRISTTQPIDDTNAEIFSEILEFFSKNYYQSANRLFDIFERNINNINISNHKLHLKFISSLIKFTRAYSITPTVLQDELIKLAKLANKFNISQLSQLIDILPIALPTTVMEKLLSTLLKQLNEAELDFTRRDLTHRTLLMLMNNMVKLYKFHQSNTQILLQKTVIELQNTCFGISNYANSSEMTLTNLISSLHKLLVITLLHDDDPSICIEILEKIILGLLERHEFLSKMTSNWGRITPETIRYLVILDKINYLIKDIRPSFSIHFNSLLDKISTSWNNNEFNLGLFHTVLLLNILKSKADKTKAEFLLQLTKETRLINLPSNELNALLTCLIGLKRRSLITFIDLEIPNQIHHKLESDTIIVLNNEGLIDTQSAIKLIENSLDRLSPSQLHRAGAFLSSLDKHENLIHEKVIYEKNIHENLSHENPKSLIYKVKRSAERLGIE